MVTWIVDVLFLRLMEITYSSWNYSLAKQLEAYQDRKICFGRPLKGDPEDDFFGNRLFGLSLAGERLRHLFARSYYSRSLWNAADSRAFWRNLFRLSSIVSSFSS